MRQRQTMQLLFPLSVALLSACSCSLWVGVIPQCAQDVPAIWRPLRVVSAFASGGGSKPSAALKHVSVSCGSQSTRNCNATRTHSALSSQRNTSKINLCSIKRLHIPQQMLPETEYHTTTTTTTPESCMEYDWSYYEESRCNQLETAEQVYRRLMERLQRHTPPSTSTDVDTLKQIWLASFTGGNIYYRA